MQNFNDQLICIDNASLNSWRRDDLTSAVTTLSRETQDADHHRLANLALVRARLQQFDLAERDARASIQVQPTIIARIALSIALGCQDKLTSAKQEFNQIFLRHEPKNECLLLLIKSIIILISGDRDEAMRRVTDLIEACAEADKALCSTVQAQMQLLVGQVALHEQDYEKALSLFRSAGASAPFLKFPELETISLMFGWDFNLLLLSVRQQTCEALYTASQTSKAVGSLRTMLNEFRAEMGASVKLSNWLENFTRRCVEASETAGDTAQAAGKNDEAIAHYSVALSLDPPSRADLIAKRNRVRLAAGAWDDAMNDLDEAGTSRFIVYTQISEALLEASRTKEAIEILHRLKSDLDKDETLSRDEGDQWVTDFSLRCVEMLEALGDVALDSEEYSEALEQYSTALSVPPPKPSQLFSKRSKAQALMGQCEDALLDADKAIELDPSSHQGYERRHAALDGMGRHGEAFGAFRTMLSTLEQSPDLNIRGLRNQYMDATTTIRREIELTIRDMPLVLIDTTTGRLYDKMQRAAVFEGLPIYDELRSSMTTQIDFARIRREVKRYYQYVMLSHKWEYNEPLLQQVKNISIYELEASPGNIKLQMFCSLVRSLGFRWAWSDTCCIDKVNNVVLQESLIAMFTWYRGSSLTIVYLRDVSSESQLPGDLQQSIWNTRAWTYQEYIAAETVRFYTEDWKPYLDLTLSNHKESPAVISEMQQVTGVSAQDMTVLRPGLERVREKLYLASMRRTTLEEDIAYSLFGIFNVAILVVYGEGNRAVGRLLEHILTGSGDVTILAWTGHEGSYNSCLPIDLTVYNELVPPHVPQHIETTELDRIVTELRSSLPDLSLVMTLHDRLHRLPSPSFSASRLQLTGIIVRLAELVHTSGPDPVLKLRVYRATTSTFGDIEIKTADNLTGMKDLCLVHPWIRPLLSQGFSDGAAALDRTTQALRFVARLRQPFGALLFEPLSRVEYRRVAADSLIMVQIREEVSLTNLIDNVRTIEVL